MRCSTPLTAIGIVVLTAIAPMRSPAQDVEPAHFHHVHLNVVDTQASFEFYKRHLGAVQVKYGGVTDALFTERSFLFFNQVDVYPHSNLETTLWHIGWGGVDGPNEYEWLKKQGVEFHTHIQQLGSNYYMYLHGPTKEVVEIYTGGKNHRYNHLHFIASDVAETVGWFSEHLGLRPRRPVRPRDPSRRSWSGGVNVDNVSIIVYGSPDPEKTPSWWPPELTEFKPTRGSNFDHIAFSYADIEPVYERMKASGVEIVEPIGRREDYELDSFFVMAPDGLLIEIVEARPIPDGAWEK